MADNENNLSNCNGIDMAETLKESSARGAARLARFFFAPPAAESCCSFGAWQKKRIVVLTPVDGVGCKWDSYLFKHSAVQAYRMLCCSLSSIICVRKSSTPRAYHMHPAGHCGRSCNRPFHQTKQCSTVPAHAPYFPSVARV